MEPKGYRPALFNSNKMEYKLEKPVHGTIGAAKYQCQIEWRNGQFIADEPVTSGGQDIGPDPYTLLLSSLATCTLVTLRMYIDRKEWDIPQLAVNTNMYQVEKEGKTITVFDRDIKFFSPVTDEQRDRLLEIAKACPVSKILHNEIIVRSYAYNETNDTPIREYTNGEVTVVWKQALCKHSGRCVSQLPGVFDVHKHPWINMEGASTDAIIAQVQQCPTGALSFKMNQSERK